MSKKSSGGIRLRGVLVLFSLVFASLGSYPTSYAVDIDDVRTALYTTFEAVVEAEDKGGNIAPLVDELNSIVQLLESASEAEYSELLNRVLSVSRDAVRVGSVGESAGTDQLYVSITIILFSGLLIILVLVLFPMLFWRFWLRSKTGWVVHS